MSETHNLDRFKILPVFDWLCVCRAMINISRWNVHWSKEVLKKRKQEKLECFSFRATRSEFIDNFFSPSFSSTYIFISSWSLRFANSSFFLVFHFAKAFILFKCAHTRWTILNDPLSRSLAKPKRRRQTVKKSRESSFFSFCFSFASDHHLYMKARSTYTHTQLNRFVASLSGSVTNDFFLKRREVGNN